MKFRQLLLCAFGFLMLNGGVKAQYGLQVGLLSDHIWSQRYQPAHIVNGDYTKFRYGGQASLWFGNTHAGMKGIFDENGFIKPETKDRLISEIKANEIVGGGYHLGLAAVNVRFADSSSWGFYLDEYLAVSTGFNNANTIGLILKGNAPYAGQTVADQDIFANLYQVRELGVGTGWKLNDQMKLGVRLRLLQGVRMLDLKRLNYSLFTETSGTQIALNADYDLLTSQQIGTVGLFDFQGFGFAADVGMTYAIGEKLELSAAINDIGATFWQANQITDQIDIDWEGVFVTSIFEDSVPEILEQEVDSLSELIFPDTVEASHTLMAPLSIRIGATYNIGTNGQVSGTLVYNPIKTGAYARLPIFSVAYQHQVIPGLTLGANAYGGGLDSFGFGAMANYRFKIGTVAIDLLAGGDNWLGMLAGSFGRGFNVYGGIGVGF